MIFGIGLSKTGTTSLHRALEILGYESVHCPAHRIYYNGSCVQLDTRKMEGIEALVDVGIFYRQLDQQFPGSKFILTTRDVDSWAGSARRHFSYRRALFRGLLLGNGAKQGVIQAYGSETFCYENYTSTFLRHEEEVRTYFSSREKDLLIFNVFNGDGWDELCDFLGKEKPNEDFPHENRWNSLNNCFPYRRIALRLLHLGSQVFSKTD